MAPVVNPVLDQHLQDFRKAVPGGSAMLRALVRDNFDVTYVRSAGSPHTWLIRARPPRHLQETFGLAPELLFLAVVGEVQSRDLQRAADEVLLSELRLDGNLVLVTDTTSKSPLAERLKLIPGSEQRIAWVAGQRAWPPLEPLLRNELPTYADIFEERDPVRGYQFVGRAAEQRELRTRVLRGDSVGVFGLRKMGKTSLVRAVTDSLDPASGLREPNVQQAPTAACVLWIDAQALDERSVDAVADEFLAALRRRMRSTNARYAAPAKTGISGLKAACEALLEAGTRLCFVIDEYDLLFEGEGESGTIPGLSRFFRLLRSWSQLFQGMVSLLFIGRDPEHLSTPEMDGVSNPVLAWFSPLWLGPIQPEQDTELLRRLGRRVGLDIGHESALLARAWTGSHPMLHRQFGAALRVRTSQRSGAKLEERKIATDPFCTQAVDLFLERTAVLEIQREVVALLRKRYPAALEMAIRLSAESASALSPLRERQGTKVLRNFGLLDDSGAALPRYLSWYIRHLLPGDRSVAA